MCVIDSPLLKADLCNVFSVKVQVYLTQTLFKDEKETTIFSAHVFLGICLQCTGAILAKCA